MENSVITPPGRDAAHRVPVKFGEPERTVGTYGDRFRA